MPVSEFFLYKKESVGDEYHQSGRELTTNLDFLPKNRWLGHHDYMHIRLLRQWRWPKLFQVASRWEIAKRRFSSNSWLLRYRPDNFQFLRPQDLFQALTYSIHERMLMRVASLGLRSPGFRYKCCTLLSLLLPFVLIDNLCKYYE